MKQLVDCVPGCSCLHDLQALGLMKTGAAPNSADAITQLLQQAGEAASEEQHEVQMLQKAATSTVQQQCPAGEQLLARKGWATEAGAPGMAAAAGALCTAAIFCFAAGAALKAPSARGGLLLGLAATLLLAALRMALCSFTPYCLSITVLLARP